MKKKIQPSSGRLNFSEILTDTLDDGKKVRLIKSAEIEIDLDKRQQEIIQGIFDYGRKLEQQARKRNAEWQKEQKKK